MVLKDVLELVVSRRFTDESLFYLESKLSEHREVLLNAFPDLTLRPKHHYIEHYPHLTKVFGPLIDVWTMRFEGKHKFFKKVIHETQNFRNVPLTLARRHQRMMAYHLDCASFLKPELQANNVKGIMISSLPGNIQDFLHQRFCLRKPKRYRFQRRRGPRPLECWRKPWCYDGCWIVNQG